MILYLAYTSIYVARVNLSVAGPKMIDANLLSTVQLGALGSIFSTIYAIGRLINGGMSDRKPPWLMLTTGLAVAGLSNILVGAFPPFIGVFVLWAANAYAQSMLWSSVLCVIYASVSMINTSLLTIMPMHYTRTGNVASVSGIMDFATYLGGGIASLIYGALIKDFGYFPMFVSWAIISVV